MLFLIIEAGMFSQIQRFGGTTAAKRGLGLAPSRFISSQCDLPMAFFGMVLRFSGNSFVVHQCGESEIRVTLEQRTERISASKPPR
jgi:hypothetical protein